MLQLFRIFSKKFSFSTRVISQTTPLCVAPFRKNPKNITSTPVYVRFLPPKFSRFSKKKLKNFYIHTCHITDLKLFLRHFHLKSNLPKGGLHSPSTGVISKTSPSCVATFEKNSKKTSPHHWLSRLPPCFVTPGLNFFWEIFPNGKKKTWTSATALKSSRTGIFRPGITARNIHMLLLLNWIYQNTTLNYV